MKAKEHHLYSVWASMMNRCTKKNKKKCYEGVTVYEPWTVRFVPRKHGPSPGLLAFADYVDANLGPQEGRTLDRIDPTKGYEPGNIRWATHSEQSRNRTPGWIAKPRDDGRLRWAHPHKNGWLARYCYKSQVYEVGVFATMELAHEAAKTHRAKLCTS